VIYVLIVVAAVHHGQVVTFQEFNSQMSCVRAAEVVLDGRRPAIWGGSPPFISVNCVPK
jgi:hypothetical protein